MQSDSQNHKIIHKASYEHIFLKEDWRVGLRTTFMEYLCSERREGISWNHFLLIKEIAKTNKYASSSLIGYKLGRPLKRAHCAHPESSTQNVEPNSFNFFNISMSLS